MKVQLLTIVSALSLLAATGAAHSQQMQPSGTTDPSSAQQPMTNAQPATTMDRTPDLGYGRQPGGSSDSGKARNGAPCTVGLSCDIYQGS
ncbi:hypothetical protein B0G75_103641 [Paraburkholderia sp. BL18I3N2]|nr:hypothetical protein B0G75_103641 [Paraburkholderia sp. BL18I3N2]